MANRYEALTDSRSALPVPASAQLAELLNLVVEDLQLTATQHNDADGKYRAVGRWLGASGSCVESFLPQIYPQGSLRIGTTLKPWRHVEFDLDLVCELASGFLLDPVVAYDLVFARMHESALYRPILEKMPRCIRLNYANDFHLDVVPAMPDPQGASITSVLIPDRTLQQWVTSNPKGYSDWFDGAAALPLRKRALMDANIEPLKSPEPIEQKAPLRLAVQLMKRWRDVAFASRSEAPPPSIVLTTLAALAYLKEEDVVAAFTGILNRTYERACREVIRLPNPANPQEEITDRWHSAPQAYEAFVDELGTLRRRWNGVVLQGSFIESARELEALFGDVPVRGAVRKFGDAHTRARGSGNLHTLRQTGTLLTGPVAGALRVPQHTFFGGQDDE